MRSTDDMIDSLVCPPPPSEPPVISEEMISGLIVPAPGWSKYIPGVLLCLIVPLLVVYYVWKANEEMRLMLKGLSSLYQWFS